MFEISIFFFTSSLYFEIFRLVGGSTLPEKDLAPSFHRAWAEGYYTWEKQLGREWQNLPHHIDTSRLELSWYQIYICINLMQET